MSLQNRGVSDYNTNMSVISTGSSEQHCFQKYNEDSNSCARSWGLFGAFPGPLCGDEDYYGSSAQEINDSYGRKEGDDEVMIIQSHSQMMENHAQLLRLLVIDKNTMMAHKRDKFPSQVEPAEDDLDEILPLDIFRLGSVAEPVVSDSSQGSGYESTAATGGSKNSSSEDKVVYEHPLASQNSTNYYYDGWKLRDCSWTSMPHGKTSASSWVSDSRNRRQGKVTNRRSSPPPPPSSSLQPPRRHNGVESWSSSSITTSKPPSKSSDEYTSCVPLSTSCRFFEARGPRPLLQVLTILEKEGSLTVKMLASLLYNFAPAISQRLQKKAGRLNSLNSEVLAQHLYKAGCVGLSDLGKVLDVAIRALRDVRGMEPHAIGLENLLQSSPGTSVSRTIIDALRNFLKLRESTQVVILAKLSVPLLACWRQLLGWCYARGAEIEAEGLGIEHITHWGYSCKICLVKHIRAPRFRCETCAAQQQQEYNICGPCFITERFQAHPGEHSFRCLFRDLRCD